MTQIRRKDLRVLLRTPALAAGLVVYPLAIALLVGLVAGYGSSKPRVALVDEDNLPRSIVVGNSTFDVQRTIDEIARNVTLVRGLAPDEASRELADGKVVAVVTVPPGFIATLQRAYIDAKLEYVRLLLHGGRGNFLGRRCRRTRSRRDAARARRATAQRAARQDPHVRSDRAPRARADRRRAARDGRSDPAARAARPLAHGGAVGAGAGVRARADDLVPRPRARRRRARGGARRERPAPACTRARLTGAPGRREGRTCIGGGARGGNGGCPGLRGGNRSRPRRRRRAVGTAAAACRRARARSASLGAAGALLGALARESRTASLVAVLVVLPVVYLGLIPREVFPAAGWVSDVLPFAHAFRLFVSSLYDLSPWGTVAREGAALAAIALVLGGAARVALGRLR